MRKHKNEKRGKNNEFTKSISQREEKKEKDICKRFFKDGVVVLLLKFVGS
jgi:hypothetical protein